MTYSEFIIETAAKIYTSNCVICEDGSVDWAGASDITIYGYKQGWENPIQAMEWCAILACRRGNRKAIPYKDWLYYNRVQPILLQPGRVSAVVHAMDSNLKNNYEK